MKVIAHRGASGDLPENTLSAIQLALDMHADAIEVDTHIVDDQIMVIHDRWLPKTTNGVGKLNDFSFAQLRMLDAGNGQKIPTLWEVLELVGGHCELNIELKSQQSAIPVVNLIKQASIALSFQPSQILLSSFNHHLLKEIKAQDPSWRVGALTACLPLDYARFASDLAAESVHIDLEAIDQRFVEDAHQRGLKVFVYTVDHIEDLLELGKMRVDGVFTNYPQLMKKAVLNLP